MSGRSCGGKELCDSGTEVVAGGSVSTLAWGNRHDPRAELSRGGADEEMSLKVVVLEMTHEDAGYRWGG